MECCICNSEDQAIYLVGESTCCYDCVDIVEDLMKYEAQQAARLFILECEVLVLQV